MAEDKARGRWDAPPTDGGPRPLALTVRRDNLLEDAFAALYGRGDALKGRLYVSIANAACAGRGRLLAQPGYQQPQLPRHSLHAMALCRYLAICSSVLHPPGVVCECVWHV